MTRPQQQAFRPRFRLSSKINLAFLGVIIWMTAAQAVILWQLSTLISVTDQPEIRSLLLSQYLERVFDAEYEAVRKTMTRNDPHDRENLSLISMEFKSVADSLGRLSERGAGRHLADSLLGAYEAYHRFLTVQPEQEKVRGHGVEEDPLVTASLLRDRVKARIRAVTEFHLPAIGRTLRIHDQLRETVTDILSIGIIGLAILVIPVIFGVLFSRSITRPIEALRAGTVKVSEAKYETIPMPATTDEVADLTRAFNLMSDELKKLDEMRMELMSEISHEMRTPLQVIKAGCYSIMHAKDGPQLTQRQRDAVAMIHQSTNRINAFVNSFLDIAKMEAGLMKFDFEDSNISELLTPLIQEAELIAQTREIKVIFETEELPPVRLDKQRIGQVFSNLLSNALKYTPNAGTITIQMKKGAETNPADRHHLGYIHIDVTDTGVGIPEDDLAQLFSKFFQAKNTPLVREKGSGLGLALVKHVVEAHGGTVSVKSKVGIGSTFTVRLPITPAS